MELGWLLNFILSWSSLCPYPLPISDFDFLSHCKLIQYDGELHDCWHAGWLMFVRYLNNDENLNLCDRTHICFVIWYVLLVCCFCAVWHAEIVRLLLCVDLSASLLPVRTYNCCNGPVMLLGQLVYLAACLCNLLVIDMLLHGCMPACCWPVGCCYLILVLAQWRCAAPLILSGTPCGLD